MVFFPATGFRFSSFLLSFFQKNDGYPFLFQKESCIIGVSKQALVGKERIREVFSMSTPNLILSKEQKKVLDHGFYNQFGQEPQRYFSAPGRTEIGGNHTDHQRGRVLAAAVNLDTQAAVRENGTDTVRILSKGRSEERR